MTNCTINYQTPFYLFNTESLVASYREFKRLFPGSYIHYAMKADAEECVLRTLNELASCFEAASVYELELLKRLKISPERIVYGSSVKPAEHIRVFYDYGVDRFAADSQEELDKIAAHAPRARVYLRVSVNDSGSVYRFSEKFGTAHLNVVPLFKHALSIGLQPYGISFHVGSQATKPTAWGSAIETLAPILQHLAELDITLEVLNIGGGFPCNYQSKTDRLDLTEISHSVYDAYNRLPCRPTLMLEPGRAIVAHAATLFASVIGRVDRIEHTWLFLDAGVYNGLFESLSYQGKIQYHVRPVRASDCANAIFALAGPTGDSWDVITRAAHLPEDIAVGDRIAFQNVGAYNLVMVGRFNGFPKPDVHFI